MRRDALWIALRTRLRTTACAVKALEVNSSWRSAEVVVYAFDRFRCDHGIERLTPLAIDGKIAPRQSQTRQTWIHADRCCAPVNNDSLPARSRSRSSLRAAAAAIYSESPELRLWYVQIFVFRGSVTPRVVGWFTNNFDITLLTCRVWKQAT